MAGQAGALASLGADIEKIMGQWERSDHLASEAAEKVMRFILGDERLQKALGEFERVRSERHSLAAIIEDFGDGDA